MMRAGRRALIASAPAMRVLSCGTSSSSPPPPQTRNESRQHLRSRRRASVLATISRLGARANCARRSAFSCWPSWKHLLEEDVKQLGQSWMGSQGARLDKQASQDYQAKSNQCKEIKREIIEPRRSHFAAGQQVAPWTCPSGKQRTRKISRPSWPSRRATKSRHPLPAGRPPVVRPMAD